MTNQADEIKQLQLLNENLLEAWDDLLEDIEINGMHEFEPYIKSKAKFKALATQTHQAEEIKELQERIKKLEHGISLTNQAHESALQSLDIFYKTKQANEISQLQLDITEVTKSRDYWQDWAGKNVIENDAEILKLQLDNAKLREALEFYADRNVYAFNYDKDLFMTDIGKDTGNVARGALLTPSQGEQNE